MIIRYAFPSLVQLLPLHRGPPSVTQCDVWVWRLCLRPQPVRVLFHARHCVVRTINSLRCKFHFAPARCVVLRFGFFESLLVLFLQVLLRCLHVCRCLRVPFQIDLVDLFWCVRVLVGFLVVLTIACGRCCRGKVSLCAQNGSLQSFLGVQG